MHLSQHQQGVFFQAHSDSKSQGQEVYSRLAQSQVNANFYHQKYLEMKSINQSIIAAIKRVYSQEVGEALEELIQQEQSASDSTHPFPDPTFLTNTFCQKMRTYNSKLVSEQSIDQLPLRPLTPQKFDHEGSTSQIKNAYNMPLSPFMNKSISRKQQYERSSSKIGMEDASTRRSYTPVRNSIATQILCELCDRVFPPNQFVCHAERCKYELQYIETESDYSKPGQGKSKHLQINYDKMMKNLMKIRQQIEQQIRLVSLSKQEVDRVSIRKTLEKDLKRVIKVINQKEEEIKKKKSYTSRVGAPSKKGPKMR